MLTAVVAAFVLHPVLHYEPSVVALLGAGVLLLVTDVEISDALAEVEWPTLVFFGGLFIMVGGLVETGSSRTCPRRWPRRPTVSSAWPRWSLLGRIGRAVGDRRQHPLRRDDVARGRSAWPSSIPGDDQRCGGRWPSAPTSGGNATAVGASANVVMLGLAKRAGHRIGFWEFTKYGLVVTVGHRRPDRCPTSALRYL